MDVKVTRIMFESALHWDFVIPRALQWTFVIPRDGYHLQIMSLHNSACILCKISIGKIYIGKISIGNKEDFGVSLFHDNGLAS